MYVEKHGKTWRIRDRVGGKQVTVASGYSTKTSARNAMTELSADKLRGEYVDPRRGKMRLADWIDIWWPAKRPGLEATTQRSEGARISNHITPLLGEFTLAEIDAVAVKAWVANLADGDEELDRAPLAPKTIRNVHGLLYAIMEEAVTQRLIRVNPCYRTGLPKVPHKEQRYLTEPEIGRLAAALPEHWRPLVLLMVSTGLRWSEAAGLKAKRLDVLARTARVEETLHELEAGTDLVWQGPKTKQSRRTVTFTVDVANLLVPLVADRERDDVVFRGPDGGPLRYRKFWRIWTKATTAAGLEGLRIHDLRHTHAAHLISHGVSLTGVQRRLGHSSITVTSDLYGHLLPVVDAMILEAVGAMLAGVDFGSGVGADDGAQPVTAGSSREQLTA